MVFGVIITYGATRWGVVEEKEVLCRETTYVNSGGACRNGSPDSVFRRTRNSGDARQLVVGPQPRQWVAGQQQLVVVEPVHLGLELVGLELRALVVIAE
jgi:hypothetical protein